MQEQINEVFTSADDLIAGQLLEPSFLPWLRRRLVNHDPAFRCQARPLPGYRGPKVGAKGAKELPLRVCIVYGG